MVTWSQKDCDLVTVNELMTENHEWNEPLIHKLFFDPDVDSILSIPLRRTDREDWLAWYKEKSGIYTVRSAHKSLMDAHSRRRQEITMVLPCLRPKMMVSYGSDCGSFLWSQRCVYFGGEFFKVFYLTIGLCHADI
jgi:hypothetical protein